LSGLITLFPDCGRDAHDSHSDGGQLTGPLPLNERRAAMSPTPAVDAAEVAQDLFILDVREDDEWTAGHVAGALHIPMSGFVERIAEVPQDTQVFVMCRVGGRSAQVANYLNQNGWDAVNIDGGMMRWEAAGRPMVSETGGQPAVV
jgi:rhodanese-related sulfurtransferase